MTKQEIELQLQECEDALTILNNSYNSLYRWIWILGGVIVLDLIGMFAFLMLGQTLIALWYLFLIGLMCFFMEKNMKGCKDIKAFIRAREAQIEALELMLEYS